MAVKLDLDALHDSVAPGVLRTAEEWLGAGQIGEITAVGGGATARVQGTTVWVGIVDRAFSAECDCADTWTGGQPMVGDPDDDLCAHAVALTIAASRAGFAWSSAATPPSQAVIDPQVRRLAEIAATLPPRRLAALVGEYAAADRKLAARLLTAAGELDAPSDRELAAARGTIRNIASAATQGRWDLEDLAKAGRQIVEEIEVLAERPTSGALLTLVEDAIQQWDQLSEPLHEAYQARDFADDPGDIGAALRSVHVGICSRLDLDPDELADRLIDLIDRAETESCLFAPDDYEALLGQQRCAAVFSARHGG